MKKILSALFATIGLSSATHAEPAVQMMDAKSIGFTMPTVAADDIQFVMPTKESFEGAPQFHEDQWCQLEFFSQDRLAEIQEILFEYKTFEKKHRTKNGWNEIFARRLKREPVMSGINATNLAKSIQANLLPSPILTTTSSALGQVKDGFTVEVSNSVFLYGINSGQGINTLGAIVEKGGDNSQLAFTFIKMHKEYKLIMVDWRLQQLLMSVNDDGEINVWYP